VDLVMLPCSGLPIFVDGEIADVILTLVRATLQGVMSSTKRKTFIGQKFYHHLCESAPLLVSFIDSCTFQPTKAGGEASSSPGSNMNGVLDISMDTFDNDDIDIQDDKKFANKIYEDKSAAFYLAYYILHSKFPVSGIRIYLNE